MQVKVHYFIDRFGTILLICCMCSTEYTRNTMCAGHRINRPLNIFSHQSILESNRTSHISLSFDV